MIIRICTEDKNLSEIESIIGRCFNCYTVTRGRGSWNGIREASVTIEIAVRHGTEGDSSDLAKQCAEEIKFLNNQEAVLVEYIDSINQLI